MWWIRPFLRLAIGVGAFGKHGHDTPRVCGKQVLPFL